MKIGMIILAGGIGTRMGHPTPKQFILLGGKPIITHVLGKVEQLEDVSRVVITCPKEFLEQTRKLLAHRNLGDRFVCIEGGATRQESVYRGLLELEGFDVVVIHEAVRPFVTVQEFRDLIDCECENAIYGAKIPFTVLEGHDFVEGTFERSKLVNVQLPQKFNVHTLRAAHDLARADGVDFTEDASLFHQYGSDRVKILEGSDINIKITSPADLVVGEAIYSEYVLGRAQDS